MDYNEKQDTFLFKNDYKYITDVDICIILTDKIIKLIKEVNIEDHDDYNFFIKDLYERLVYLKRNLKNIK